MKKKLLLSAVSLVIAILLAELLLRLFAWPWITQIYVLDDKCLFRPKADSAHYFHYVPPNQGPKILVSVNTDGFRGPEFDFEEGAPRVMVYGDSFVMAEFSEHEDSYTAQLEKQLTEALKGPVHVINAGTAGGGPDQYTARIPEEVAKWKPDLLIVAIYAGNDFGDLIRDKMFRLQDDGSIAPNPFTISKKVRDYFSAGDATAIYRLYRRLRIAERMETGWQSMDAAEGTDRQAMLHRLIEADLELCRSEFKAFVTHGRNDVRALLEDHYDSDMSADPNGESSVYKLKLMEGVLALIAKQAADAKVPLLFLSIPAPVDVVENYGGGVVDREKFPDYRPSRLTDEVTRIAGELGVPCVDFFEPFREQGEKVYFLAPDVHWNNTGQRLAAEITRKRILSEGLLK